jgi:glycosyltransferase involved in cell wall biosynthesis
MLVDARSLALFGFQALIVLSNYMKEELAAIGLPRDGIRVIPPFPHSLDFGYTPASEGEGVLFAGRVVWAKGIFDLLEAMRIDRSLRVKVAGAGTIEETVLGRVRKCGLGDRIEFLDWIPHGGMAEAYRRARVLALPSRWSEPFGIVGLEAQTLGRPVVAYDVGGVRDWLEDGRTGFLVEPGDAAGLAEKLGFLARNPAEADRLGRQARELTLERFDRERLMGELVELYREVARGGREGPPLNRST